MRAMQHTNVNKINYILFIVAALAIMHFTRNVTIRPDGDDQYFINLLSSNDVWGILKARYLTWSGRLGVEFALLHTIKLSYFWIIAIPACIFVTCYSMVVITCEKVNVGFALILAVLLFTLMKSSVIDDAVLWVTGFYNYLLPAALATLTLAICLKPGRYICIAKIVPLIAPFIYAYSEQIALATILALLVIFVFSKECHKSLCLMSLIVTIVNFMVCYLSPGSTERAQTEAWFAFPDYLTLNIFQKATLGVYLLHTHLSDVTNTPYLIFLVTCLVTGLISFRKDVLTLIACGLVALQVFVMFYLYKHAENNMLSFSPERFTSVKTYMFVLIDLVSFFSVLYISAKCFDNNYLTATALVIGALSVVAMGLSPTVFSSGTRTMFVFDLSVIMAIALIINSKIAEYNR